MHNLIFAVILLISFASFSQQAQAQDKKQAIENTLDTFLATNTLRKTHDDFWAEELIYTSSNGTRFGKDNIMSGFSEKPEAKNDDVSKWTAKEVDIRLYGEIAIVAFKLFNHNAQGELVQRYFNTGTLTLRDGRWQAVAWQATKIPNEAKSQ